MRRMAILCLTVLVLSVFFSLSTSANENAELPLPTVSAKAVALIDLDGRIVYANRAEERLPMASTTKIMTATVALESADPNERVTVTPDAVGIEGSSAYLMAGETFVMKDLLYALLLSSANDAAVAIAIHIDGSVEAFAERMNAKADELGLTSTHFTNPHGLDDEAHYTTALDLARLTAYALRNEQFAEIVSTVRYECPMSNGEGTRLFVNHNRLLRSYEGAIGVKTGYTKRTGRCLVSAAKRNGLTLICVTLGDPDDWKDHSALLDYGFSRYEPYTLTESEGVSFTLPAVGAVQNELTLSTRDSVSLMLPRGSSVAQSIECPRFVYGGIEEGTAVGRVVWKVDGIEVAHTPLYAETALESVDYPTLWERIAVFFADLWAFIKDLFD